MHINIFFLDIDECLTSPCLHDGTCNNTEGSYHCICAMGWSGPNCEIGNISLSFFLSVFLLSFFLSFFFHILLNI